jgi:hypothetical protein
MLVAVKDIKPNPFRSLDRYPIDRAKVEFLKESIESTGFWENVVAREKDGVVELAYGHHRLIALKEALGPNAKVEIIIKDLDDETMIKIMARENMTEWGTSATVEQETVRAVVLAYAEGKIELPKVPKDTHKTVIRYAPRFAVGNEDALGRLHPYTPATLGRFLGWTNTRNRGERGVVEEADRKVIRTLDTLAALAEGIFSEKQFDGIGTKMAGAAVEETKHAEEIAKQAGKSDKEVKRIKQRVGYEILKRARSGGIGYKDAPNIRHKILKEEVGPRKAIPDINDFVKRLASDLRGILTTGDPLLVRLTEAEKFVDDIRDKPKRMLCEALDAVIGQSQKHKARFATSRALVARK